MHNLTTTYGPRSVSAEIAVASDGGYFVTAEPNWQSHDSAIVFSKTLSPVRAAGYAVHGITAVAAMLALSSEMPPTMPFADPSEIGRVFTPTRAAPALSDEFVVARDEMAIYACLEEGWDGIGSQPPVREVVDDALAFLVALPKDLPAPEATVSADGTVGWFWKTANHYASVAFSGDRRFAYYGENRDSGLSARGASVFDRRSIPNDLLEIIRMA